MLLLTLTSLRAATAHNDLALMVQRGDISSATRIGMERLERSGAADPAQRALLGQLVGHCLLAGGREEEAEELFQRQRRVYESISRATVRWHSALDQGLLLLQLHRNQRAADAFNTLADDARAPCDLRIQAMAGAAVAMHRGGEAGLAFQALDVARRLSDQVPDRRVAQLVDCVALELSALHRDRASEALDDHAMGAAYRESAEQVASHDVLHQQLGAAAAAFADSIPLVAFRLRHLQRLLGRDCLGVLAATHVAEALAWLRERRLAGFEADARVEAARMLIGRNAVGAAGEIIAPLAYSEQQAACSRHALDLQYCMARLHMHQGRHADALRLYRQHAQHAVLALRSDAAAQKKTPRFLEQPGEARQGDAARMRLPVRYRTAYQYIMDHLNDEGLSVRLVATQLNVTERALQMAFRTHLGMTPAELIRTRRMERIREELRNDSSGRGVLEVASTWGITDRSVLARNYRSRFGETPTQTLRGHAVA
jgi:AraC-like DNA-binding protein